MMYVAAIVVVVQHVASQQTATSTVTTTTSYLTTSISNAVNATVSNATNSTAGTFEYTCGCVGSVLVLAVRYVLQKAGLYCNGNVQFYYCKPALMRT